MNRARLPAALAATLAMSLGSWSLAQAPGAPSAAAASAHSRANAPPSRAASSAQTRTAPPPPSASPSDAPAARPPNHPPTGMASSGGDAITPDPSLPAGTIAVTVLDGDDKPVSGAQVELSIVRESVEKGERRDQRSAETDAAGQHRFDGLPVGHEVRFSLTTTLAGARFASATFGLDDRRGVRARLHAYQPVTDLATAALVIQSVVALELEQDSIAVTELIHTTNLGKTAYVPTNVVFPLPDGYHAFRAEPGPNGAAIEERHGQAALVGTFPPGSADFSFRYQLPLEGDSEQRLTIAQLPRMLQTRVMVGAGPQMGLQVQGFPPARAGTRRDGQRVLETTKRKDLRTNISDLMTDTKPGAIEITLSGLPSRGMGRWIAALLGAVALAGGLWQRAAKPAGGEAAQERLRDLLEARDALLADLARLERARRDGRVGPKSYRKLHATLLDAVARVLSQLDDAGQGEAGRRLPGEPPPEAARRPPKRRRKRAAKGRRG